MFRSIGKPITPFLIMGIVLTSFGSFFAVILGPRGLVVTGLVSLIGLGLLIIGVARLGDAVQYLAMRERDREHDVE